MGEHVKAKLGNAGVKRLLILQVLVSGIISFALFVFFSTKEAASAALGGIVAIIPIMIFARQLFYYQGARAARQIVNSFYKAEALKIALSIILFVLVFSMLEINPLAFFFTYILVLMCYWFAPLIFANKQNRPKSD